MSETKTAELITDEQTLMGAKSRFGHAIQVYDDGYGPLWIHRDSMGISGIVRAQTWHDAYSICEDEFFPEATETVEDMQREYSVIYKSGRELWMHENGGNVGLWTQLTDEQRVIECQKPGKQVPFEHEFTEHPCWQESCGIRPNGPNKRDTLKHGIYAKDLNGDWLERLTPSLLAELEIELEIGEVTA